jgi:hypothetical protein
MTDDAGALAPIEDDGSTGADAVPPVDIPDRLLPELEDFGIEPERKGVCLDTPLNRRLIGAAGLSWLPLYDQDGSLSDYLLCLAPEYEQEIRDQGIRNKGILLTNVHDLDSDYKTDVDLTLLPEVEKVVPEWVLSETHRWIRIRNRRFDDKNPDYMKHVRRAPVRCRKLKADGRRCSKWSAGTGAVTDMQLCSTHIRVVEGNRMRMRESTVRKARMRLDEMAMGAVSRLEQLAEGADSDAVKLKANTEILDRAGIRGGTEIDMRASIETKPASEVLAERLAALVRPAIEEGVVAEEESEDGVATQD